MELYAVVITILTLYSLIMNVYQRLIIKDLKSDLNAFIERDEKLKLTKRIKKINELKKVMSDDEIKKLVNNKII